MNPEVIQRLLELPDFREFVAFVAEQAQALQENPDPTGKTNDMVAAEVHGRHLASKTIVNILAPLLNSQAAPTGASNKEFVM